MNFEQWLKANDYDGATLTDVQRKHLEAAWRAETEAANAHDDELRRMQANAERVDEIKRLTSQAAASHPHNPTKLAQLEALRNSAIEDPKMSVQEFKIALMRQDRMLGSIVSTPRQPQVNDETLEAALCMGQGLGSLEKSFSERTLEAASREFGRAFSLMDFMSYAAQRNGYRGSFSKGNLLPVLRAAFQGGKQSEMYSVGPSTIDASGILSNTANKFIRDSFNFVEADWRLISAIRAVSDFKEISTHSLTGDLTYQELPPGGRIEHGTLGGEEYKNQARSYARLLGIDRRDFINDDLSAFTSVARKLGRGGALKLNDVFWTEFLDDATFFPTDKSKDNYDDGADTLMDLTGLANAYGLFQSQVDPDGNPSGITPAIVLVPPQLWPAAFTLLNSTQLNLATSTAAATGTTSPWAGMFRLVKSRYLSVLGGSAGAKAWYMLADPNDVPVIETVFLFGAEMPTVETGEMDFDRLGIAMRGYHDFGVRKQEYRAGVKMKGDT